MGDERPARANRRRALVAHETGGGSHHVATLRLAAALKRRGLLVDFAALRLHVVDPPAPAFDRLFQAPVLPRIFGGGRHATNKPARSYSEILRQLEFDRPLVVRRQIDAWRSLFTITQPDILVADYSPGAVLAARGKIQTVAFGSPFCVPCSVNGRLAPFDLDQPDNVEDEVAILMAVNAALTDLGDPPVDDLPSAFVPSLRFPAGLVELDPYAQVRTEELFPPVVESCTAGAGAGSTIISFLPRSHKNHPAIVETLAEFGPSIRIDDNDFQAPAKTKLERAGARIEATPVDANEMARSGALILSHGGHHSVTRALLAGVPQLIIPADVEKIYHARVIERMGVGISVNWSTISGPTLRAAIEQVFGNQSYALRARALSRQFRQRQVGDTIEAIAERISRLVPV